MVPSPPAPRASRPTHPSPQGETGTPPAARPESCTPRLPASPPDQPRCARRQIAAATAACRSAPPAERRASPRRLESFCPAPASRPEFRENLPRPAHPSTSPAVHCRPAPGPPCGPCTHPALYTTAQRLSSRHSEPASLRPAAPPAGRDPGSRAAPAAPRESQKTSPYSARCPAQSSASQ